jgi:hypothetical protein
VLKIGFVKAVKKYEEVNHSPPKKVPVLFQHRKNYFLYIMIVFGISYFFKSTFSSVSDQNTLYADPGPGF